MAKTIRWKGKHMGNLKFTLDQQQRRIDSRISAILSDVAYDTVPYMKHIIATTPSGIVRTKDNRNDTGNMSSQVNSEMRSKTVLALGWVKDPEGYFAEQDQGTGTKTFGWGNVPPMHMLSLGEEFAKDEFIKSMRKMFN